MFVRTMQASEDFFATKTHKCVSFILSGCWITLPDHRNVSRVLLSNNRKINCDSRATGSEPISKYEAAKPPQRSCSTGIKAELCKRKQPYAWAIRKQARSAAAVTIRRKSSWTNEQYHKLWVKQNVLQKPLHATTEKILSVAVTAWADGPVGSSISQRQRLCKSGKPGLTPVNARLWHRAKQAQKGLPFVAVKLRKS